MTVAEKIREYQAQTTGSDTWYGHALIPGIKYTSGAKFVADEAGAHWLLDLVASHQLDPKVKAEEFQIWVLFTQDNPDHPWVAECWTDKPGAEGSRVVARQEIEFSDFPKELAPFKLWFQNQTIFLPEEY